MHTTALTIVESPDHELSGHPESPHRFSSFHQLFDMPISDGWLNIEPQPVEQQDLLTIHPEDYLEALRQAVKLAPGFVDYGDTYVTQASYDSACLAVGGLLNVLEAILTGEASNGFAIIRPPGHHATPTRALGFCLLSNIAIAARIAQRSGYERVVIIDFDVHHGNGTQAIFEDDQSVLYFSTHQQGIFPGTGQIHEKGISEGEGTIINVPLPARAGDVAITEAFDQILLPAVDRFNPNMIMVSAGFDAHWRDPLAMLQMTTRGYHQLAERILSIAREHCDGRLLLALEGGYDPTTLKECIAAILLALADEGYPDDDPDEPPYPEPSIEPLLVRAKAIHDL